MGKCRTYNFTGDSDSILREPRIVIGPQWYYPLIELILVNVISINTMIFGKHSRYAWTLGIGIFILFIQNLSFVLLVMQNPGFANRDIRIHKSSHLDKARLIR
jgi:hypothetical protein